MIDTEIAEPKRTVAVVIDGDKVGLLKHSGMRFIDNYSQEGVMNIAKWLYPTLRTLDCRICILEEGEDWRKLGTKGFSIQTDKALRRFAGLE